MIRNVKSFKIVGTEAVAIHVETEISNGIGIHLVGLPDVVMKESLLRTVTALQAMGFRIPGKKIVVNLAPADLYKSGNGYDLPVALGIIAASGQKELGHLEEFVVAGELGLDGTVRTVPGAIQAAELAKKEGLKLLLPTEDAKYAAEVFAGEVEIYAADTLLSAIDAVSGSGTDTVEAEYRERSEEPGIWDNLKGHYAEKRGLEIAAAGGHPVFMAGVPGSEKSLLAKALSEILPPMSKEENMEVLRVYSATGRYAVPGMRPFRAPHPYVSMPALFGGGSGENIMPGEVSLAHNGILFMDDFAEMPKNPKEALRGPMEDGGITIARLHSKVHYPTKFLPVFASHLCPCGWYGEGDRCTCTEEQRKAYLARLSGPVMDRMTMQLWVQPPYGGTVATEPRSAVAERVAAARAVQKERYRDESFETNDGLDAKSADKYCRLDEDTRNLMERLVTGLGLSARAYLRILKMARTIADLAGSEEIAPAHVAEAASYRFLDRIGTISK